MYECVCVCDLNVLWQLLDKAHAVPTPYILLIHMLFLLIHEIVNLGKLS